MFHISLHPNFDSKTWNNTICVSKLLNRRDNAWSDWMEKNVTGVGSAHNGATIVIMYFLTW